MNTAVILFFISLSIVAYSFLGYAVLVYLASLLENNGVEKRAILPMVTVLTIVHNEEKGIRRKLEDSLALDYPKERLELIFVSDGSTDYTAQIIQSYRERGIIFYDHKVQRGKIAALNDSVSLARGEIIMFSDADVLLKPDTVRKLVRNFYDPSVGGVCGNHRIIEDYSAVEVGEGIHFHSDGFIKARESRISSMIAPWCGTYAVRKSLFTPVSEGVNDDLFISLGVVKQGYRFVFEPEAICYALPSCTNAREETSRRIRNTQASLRTLYFMRELLNPLRYGRYSILLFSHKLLRRLAPFFLITLFMANLLVAERSGFFYGCFVLQCLFYLVSILGFLLQNRKIPWKAFYIPFYFFLGNAGTLLGVVSFLRGRKKISWTPIRN